jgi:tetratricopeptide (TPR) repeat protein
MEIGANNLKQIDEKEAFNQAFAYLKKGDARLCINTCRSALIHYPDDINLLCLISRASISIRLFEDAQGFLNEATRLNPKSSIARETYGDLLLVQGKAEEAIREYLFVKELNPKNYQIEHKINHAREVQKKLSKEIYDALEKAGEDKKGEVKVSFDEEIKEAIDHQESGRGELAEEIYRNILKQDPNHIEAARLLAGIAMEHEKFKDAEIFLLRVIKNAPRYPRAWADLVKTQREQDKFDEALDSAARLISLDPNIPESYMVRASVEGEAGMHHEAIETYKKALSISPEKPGALCSMAHHLKTVGKQDEAISVYREAIKIQPDHTESYWSMANLKTFSFKDREIRDMEDLLSNKDLPDIGRIHLHNALGLEYESRRNYDKAFENLCNCNTLRRKSESYDPVEYETMIDKIIEILSLKKLKRKPVKESKVTPIFIVGLPRSGSTLIEQILASHSCIEGTHELHEMSMSMRHIREVSNINKRFPEALENFRPKEWKMLGEEYLKTTEKYRTDKLFFIDKNPNNFTFIGAIKLAIPNAKIINAKRHPLDSCFGTFKQLFASGQPFSYDLTELGEYYMEYHRIMNYWHESCKGFVLDVNYESVVSDLDSQVERILQFCELPYEEKCLRFYETDRAVKTASSEQVRKPIYSSSVNLWRNYEEKLTDLIEILEPVLKELPKEDQPKSFVSH